MKKHVPFIISIASGCSAAAGEPGKLDPSAAQTTFDSDTGGTSSTTGTSTDATPGIPTTSGGGSGDAETTTASTGDAAVCGDGVIEGSELCDDGFAANKPENPCTKGCTPARCGDGYVQASNHETCDDGDFNVEIAGYGQCSTTCTRSAWCGDGIVQSEAGEECEPGAAEDDTCGAMCRHASRFVFLIDTLHTGDLGGLAGADKRCNQAVADHPGLTGTYRAWLMVDGQTLAARFPEFTEPGSWNFTNTSTGLLATSFAELLTKGPAEPIAFTATGDALPQAPVWTGITKDGLAAGGDCAQWTSENGSPALAGNSGYVPNVGPQALQWRLDRAWTDHGIKLECTELKHFYCVQVAD